MFTASMALVLLALTGSAAPQASGPVVRLYRSWQPPNLTLVQGLFRVDDELLGTAGARCSYVVQLSVRDTAGTPLVSNEWKGQCPPPAAGQRRAALETFQFAVVPAHYTVEVTVHPQDDPEASHTTRLPLTSLPASTLASDLLLGREAGWIDSAQDKQWTFHKGKLGIRTASEIVATEADPQIAYYLEVYPETGHPLNGSLVGVIRMADGREIHRMTLQQLQDVAQSRPLAGNFSVAGLAPGSYELETRLELRDTVITRSHPFSMAAPEPVVAGGTAAGGRTGYFFTLGDRELAQLFDPVVVFMDHNTRDLYERLNPDGKRRFLAQYFNGEEPTVGAGEKNDLDQYLERVRHVIETYDETVGRESREGWRTDRGRIYLRRGEPASQVTRQAPRSGGVPFEVWYYPIGAGYAYLFADETRLGNYRLIFSTDPAEVSIPGWEKRVGYDAIEELQRLGVRITGTSGAGIQ